MNENGGAYIGVGDQYARHLQSPRMNDIIRIADGLVALPKMGGKMIASSRNATMMYDTGRAIVTGSRGLAGKAAQPGDGRSVQVNLIGAIGSDFFGILLNG